MMPERGTWWLSIITGELEKEKWLFRDESKACMDDNAT